MEELKEMNQEKSSSLVMTGKKRKLQSAIDFLSTYSLAFLIIAILLAILFIFVGIPKSTIPPQCTAYSGFTCVDAVYSINQSTIINGTSTKGSRLFINVIDSSPGTVNISSFDAAIGGVKGIGGCKPSTLTNGNTAICWANFSVTPALNNIYTGTYNISANYCPPSSSTCAASSTFTYGGAVTVLAGTNQPVSITTMKFTTISSTTSTSTTSTSTTSTTSTTTTISISACQPEVFVSPAANTIFIGNNETLKATVICDKPGPFSYQWYEAEWQSFLFKSNKQPNHLFNLSLFSGSSNNNQNNTRFISPNTFGYCGQFTEITGATSQNYSFVTNQSFLSNNVTRCFYVNVTNQAGNTISSSNDTINYPLPTDIATAPNGNLYVTNSGNDTINVFNTKINEINTIPLSFSPYSISISPNGAYAYVASYYNVSILNLSTNTIAGNVIGLSSGTNIVAIAPSGAYAYVSSYYSNTINVINTSTNKVIKNLTNITTTKYTYPISISFTPSGAYAYITNYDEYGLYTSDIINTTTGKLTNKTFTPSSHIAIAPNGVYAYITSYSINNNFVGDNANVSILNLSTNKITGNITYDSGTNFYSQNVTGITFSLNGKYAYMTLNSGNGGTYTDIVMINTTTSKIQSIVNYSIYDLYGGIAYVNLATPFFPFLMPNSTPVFPNTSVYTGGGSYPIFLYATHKLTLTGNVINNTIVLYNYSKVYGGKPPYKIKIWEYHNNTPNNTYPNTTLSFKSEKYYINTTGFTPTTLNPGYKPSNYFMNVSITDSQPSPITLNFSLPLDILSYRQNIAFAGTDSPSPYNMSFIINTTDNTLQNYLPPPYNEIQLISTAFNPSGTLEYTLMSLDSTYAYAELTLTNPADPFLSEITNNLKLSLNDPYLNNSVAANGGLIINNSTFQNTTNLQNVKVTGSSYPSYYGNPISFQVVANPNGKYIYEINAVTYKNITLSNGTILYNNTAIEVVVINASSLSIDNKILLFNYSVVPLNGVPGTESGFYLNTNIHTPLTTINYTPQQTTLFIRADTLVNNVFTQRRLILELNQSNTNPPNFSFHILHTFNFSIGGITNGAYSQLFTTNSSISASHTIPLIAFNLLNSTPFNLFYPDYNNSVNRFEQINIAPHSCYMYLLSLNPFINYIGAKPNKLIYILGGESTPKIISLPGDNFTEYYETQPIAFNNQGTLAYIPAISDGSADGIAAINVLNGSLIKIIKTGYGTGVGQTGISFDPNTTSEIQSSQVCSNLLVKATPSFSILTQGQSESLSSNKFIIGRPLFPYIYQWYEEPPGSSSFSSIPRANFANYQFITSTSTPTGYYRFYINVTNGNGFIGQSNNITVDVTPQTPGLNTSNPTAPTLTPPPPSLCPPIFGCKTIGPDNITIGTYSSPFTFTCPNASSISIPGYVETGGQIVDAVGVKLIGGGGGGGSGFSEYLTTENYTSGGNSGGGGSYIQGAFKYNNSYFTPGQNIQGTDNITYCVGKGGLGGYVSSSSNGDGTSGNASAFAVTGGTTGIFGGITEDPASGFNNNSGTSQLPGSSSQVGYPGYAVYLPNPYYQVAIYGHEGNFGSYLYTTASSGSATGGAATPGLWPNNPYVGGGGAGGNSSFTPYTWTAGGNGQNGLIQFAFHFWNGNSSWQANPIVSRQHFLDKYGVYST